jgi:predicted PurR-regulated permease PerM
MEKKNVEMKRWLILIIVILIGYWIANNLSVLGDFFKLIGNILSPFILGGCLAFILNIPMSFFEKKLSKIKTRKGKKIKNRKVLRIMSILFAILVILFVLIFIITLIVPELINIGKMLIDNIPFYAEEISRLIEQYGEKIPDINNMIQEANIDIEGIKDQIINQISGLLTSSISIIGNIVSAIVNFFIGIVFAIYLLMDKEKLQNQAKKILYAYLRKERADKIVKIGSVSNSTFRSFFTVQCLEATILGILCMIGMLILKIPYAVSIGILVGVTALVPIVGAFIGVLIGAILILSVNPIKVITFIVFFLILQQVEGNLIYPRVVGNSVGLPGMWVLVAVTVGGSLGGILGMLIGVPIASIVYTLLKEDVNLKLEKTIEN